MPLNPLTRSSTHRLSTSADQIICVRSRSVGSCDMHQLVCGTLPNVRHIRMGQPGESAVYAQLPFIMCR